MKNTTRSSITMLKKITEEYNTSIEKALIKKNKIDEYEKEVDYTMEFVENLYNINLPALSKSEAKNFGEALIRIHFPTLYKLWNCDTHLPF